MSSTFCFPIRPRDRPSVNNLCRIKNESMFSAPVIAVSMKPYIIIALDILFKKAH